MRDPNHWHPPLEPIWVVQPNHIQYHFNAHLHTNGVTVGICKIQLLGWDMDLFKYKNCLLPGVNKFDIFNNLSPGVEFQKLLRWRHLYLNKLYLNASEYQIQSISLAVRGGASDLIPHHVVFRPALYFLDGNICLGIFFLQYWCFCLKIQFVRRDTIILRKIS